MGLLASGQAWLQTVCESESQTITYRRSTTALTGIKANPDEPDQTSVDTFGPGATLALAKRDWVLAWSELSTLTPSEPQDGDQIDLVIGATTHRWTVRSNETGRTFQEQDNRRSRIAVHTVYDGPVT